MTNETLLSVKNLAITFSTSKGPVHAVRGVSFDLGRERLGIVGESGSGKSQTGRAILEGLVGALLPQPRPQHRPIPIPVTPPRRR